MLPFCPFLRANCFAIICLLLFTLFPIISHGSRSRSYMHSFFLGMSLRFLSCMQSFLAKSFALRDMSFCSLSFIACFAISRYVLSRSLSLVCISIPGYHLALTLYCMHCNLLIWLLALFLFHACFFLNIFSHSLSIVCIEILWYYFSPPLSCLLFVPHWPAITFHFQILG